MSSLAGLLGLPDCPAYCGSKAAIRVYGEAVRALVVQHGVQVTVVCPGFVDTPMSRNLPFELPFLWGVERAAEYIVQQGAGTPRNPVSVAAKNRYPVCESSTTVNDRPHPGCRKGKRHDEVTPASEVKIIRVEGKREIRDWLAVPHRVFADDPAWVPPLHFLERRRISPKHAPFFSFGEAALFLAYRDGVAIGRISAQINRRHLERYRDGAGHFGFFDCLDDPDAAVALGSGAESWLRERGLRRMVGPLNFSVNEECGCLVSGFETPPAMLMTHARTWTGRLLENAGLQKEIDLFAYRLVPTEAPKRVYEIAELASHTRFARLTWADTQRRCELSLTFSMMHGAPTGDLFHLVLLKSTLLSPRCDPSSEGITDASFFSRTSRWDLWLVCRISTRSSRRSTEVCCPSIGLGCCGG
jgi:short chain dehydrogenase